ncbi:MAG: hypothetical protein R3242_02965 [Akkermansiaceae bacterium]|nr:hypothetical protein [Akkermansiaceae bacterium]
MLIDFLIQTGWITAGLVALIPVVLIAYRITDKILQPPGVDLVIGLYTFIPWIVGYCLWDWSGVLASVLAEVLCLHIFCIADRLVRGRPTRTIMQANHQLVGVLRNQLGLHATLPAVPLFWAVRLGSFTVYPLVALFAKLPQYKHKEWVTISRQKFEGLIGYDMVWCLYCDWMTGLWSLVTEQLRNVESFWCPIRFHADKKCENCVSSFPDLEEWTDHRASTNEVVDLLKEKYEGRESNSWWGHKERCNSCPSSADPADSNHSEHQGSA